MPYNTPDVLAHVYAFARTVEDAQRIADDANREGATRKGKFVPGTFVVSHIEGRMPAVTGTLTGNQGAIAPLKSVSDEDLLRAADTETAWQLSDYQVECLVHELVELRGLVRK